MKLHSSPASPFARQVRVALAELAMEDEVAVVDTAVSPVHRNVDYARVNPLRRVPALVLASGVVLQDSTVILLFLDDRAGGGALVPRGAARFPVLAAHSLAQGAIEAAVGLRYETFLRPEPLRWQTWIDDRLDKIDATLRWFEQQPQLLQEPFDLTQIGLACLLGYLDFRLADRDWRTPNPALAGWYDEVSRRPSLAATAPRA